MKVRLPCVSGQFYENEKRLLEQQVTNCLPVKRVRRRAKALLVPHAGLMYSGNVAGEIYASLEWGETILFLGPNHTGEGRPFSVSTADSWRTPLGDVAIDRKLRKFLLHHLPEVEEDDAAHRHEHSLEVQLPFLQMLSKKTKIVPICIGLSSFGAYRKFGDHLAETLRQLGETLIVIASSDMTHYEPHQQAVEKDHYAIQAILSLNPDELIHRVQERQISMCGVAPAIAMLSYVRKEGAAQGELLRYQTSGDVSGDRSSVVGYAGIFIPPGS